MGKLLLIVTCLAAAGCTKSEAPPENMAAPVSHASVPAAKPDPRPVIAVLGDSLAEGFGVETGKSFPDELQRELDGHRYAYRVVNLGISGDTTTGGLGRIQSVLDLQPAIVIVELGGNDGLRGVPIASTRANLEKMIQAAQGHGAKVLLAGMTLPPNYGADYIRSFEKVYQELAAKYRLQSIPFLMEDIRSQLSSHPGLMQRDGIHPTAEGHAIIAKTVFRYLHTMLKRAGNAA